ncbi:DUF4232 domain-containing protein [Streptomyces sp. NPDC004031]
MNTKTARTGPARRGLRGALLGAAAVAALLTVTACQGDDDAAGPSSPASTGTGTPRATATTADSGTGTGTAKATPSEQVGDTGETSGGNGTKYKDCQVTELNTAVELKDPSGDTPRHFLLTVTNGTRTPCVLNESPQVRLGAGNDADIVRTLGEQNTEPLVVPGGGKAYAGLYVFGADEGGEAEYDRSDRFTATLVSGDGTELNGTLIFDLPDGLDSVSYDDAARLYGWALTEGMAMRPVTQI